MSELAIHRRVSRMNYLRRCAEASAVQAYQKRCLSLAPGTEIGYVVTDTAKWEVDAERDATEFDAGYYCGKLLEKAWDEVAFIFVLVLCVCKNGLVLVLMKHHQIDIFKCCRS